MVVVVGSSSCSHHRAQHHAPKGSSHLERKKKEFDLRKKGEVVSVFSKFFFQLSFHLDLDLNKKEKKKRTIPPMPPIPPIPEP